MDKKLVTSFDKNQAELVKLQAEEAKLIEQATKGIKDQIATVQKRDKDLRAKIKESMEKYGVKKFETDSITISYVDETTRKSLDTARIKEEAPGIYDKYLKETKVNSSIRIKVKE